MRGAGASLLVPEDRWEHRRGEGARIWAITLSILLHAGLLYLAGNWIGQHRLRTVEAPFVVNLVVPAPVARELPRPREEATAETSSPPIARLEEVVPEVGAGIPAAPLLEPVPEPPITPPLREPQRGESTAAEAGVIREARRDVAGEASKRLLEQMDTLSWLPLAPAPRRSPTESRKQPGMHPGAVAGIEGPLGKRGLVYFEKPSYPQWARQAGIEAQVRFRFWVSSQGNVFRILALKKSAYPELESLARQALARWRFEPLPRGEEREEWGEVPFVWELRRSGSAG